jgi:hypothetical protein
MEISAAKGQLERDQQLHLITSTTCCSVENGDQDLVSLLTGGKVAGGPWIVLANRDTGSIKFHVY